MLKQSTRLPVVILPEHRTGSVILGNSQKSNALQQFGKFKPCRINLGYNVPHLFCLPLNRGSCSLVTHFTSTHKWLQVTWKLLPLQQAARFLLLFCCCCSGIPQWLNGTFSDEVTECSSGSESNKVISGIASSLHTVAGPSGVRERLRI